MYYKQSRNLIILMKMVQPMRTVRYCEATIYPSYFRIALPLVAAPTQPAQQKHSSPHFPALACLSRNKNKDTNKHPRANNFTHITHRNPYSLHTFIGDTRIPSRQSSWTPLRPLRNQQTTTISVAIPLKRIQTANHQRGEALAHRMIESATALSVQP